tara:strand:- start:700 stop:1500 length:801 start_codon:yes stop_codon:yes gene_type:complete
MTKTPDSISQYPSTFSGLLKLVTFLRGPFGCPWDKEQTRSSMKHFIVEELYELLDAIDQDDEKGIHEELGDLIFNIAFQFKLCEESDNVTAEKIFEQLKQKLIDRHPDLFKDKLVGNARDIESSWHNLKNKKRETTNEPSILTGISSSMPALYYAYSLQERASWAGFDWEKDEDVITKINEEVDELRLSQTTPEMEEELGDILFTVVNLARRLGIDAEGALRGSSTKFYKRFSRMEKLTIDRGIDFRHTNLSEKDALWEEAKQIAD